MRSIYKYDIGEAPICHITGPITNILCAGEQNDGIKVWAEVDTTISNKKYEIVVIGTGWGADIFSKDGTPIFDTHKYIGTVPLEGGRLIFHLYAKEIVPEQTKEQIKVSIGKNETYHTKQQSKIKLDVLERLI
jgi:redox-regulated HSP33 family molecular chaperone